MLYHVVLVSAVQQLESDMVVCTNPFGASLPPPPTSPGHRTAPGRAACVAQQLPARCLFHAWQCVYINAAVSFAPPLLPLLCPQAPSLLLHLNTFLKFEDRIRFTNSEASTESYTTWFPL